MPLWLGASVTTVKEGSYATWLWFSSCDFESIIQFEVRPGNVGTQRVTACSPAALLAMARSRVDGLTDDWRHGGLSPGGSF